MSLAAFTHPLPIWHKHHCVSPPRCRRFPVRATLSIPLGDPGGVGDERHFHSEDTKRKISAAVMRRAEFRRRRAEDYILAMLQAQNASEDSNSESESETKREKNSEGKDGRPRRRRPMSAESRAKISAALKGRAKTPEHRENLRKRFEGESNPMYGRKLSEESRAKISAALSRRKKKKKAQERTVSQDALDELKEKAVNSRLLGSSDKPVLKKRSAQRRIEDKAEAERVEEILKQVANMNAPPENVVKTRRNMEQKLAEKNSDCKLCGATGFVKCPACAGSFGVASAKCEVCFGAGAVFCQVCYGVGRLETGGEA